MSVMLRKLVLVVTVLTLLVTLLVGCSTNTQPTTPAATTPAATTPTTPAATTPAATTPKPTTPAATTPAATTPATTVAVKPLKLIFSHMHPASNPQSVGCDAWAKEVEKRTNGRVTFTRYWSGSLLPGKDNVEGLKNGVADVASIAPSWSPAMTPLWNGLVSSVLVTSDEVAHFQSMNSIKDMPELVNEYSKLNQKMICPMVTSVYHLFLTKAIATKDEFKGLRVRILGSQGLLAQAIGMVPVGMTSAEIYDALSKKTIDGVFFYSGAGLQYGFGEVAKHFILMGVANGGGTFNINMDTWKKLPADLQLIFLDVGENYLPETYRKIYDDAAEADVATMKKNGITLYRLS
ncbi:MAG: TRAP transporter substrate-binding protein DctP, partial [Dehalococcoidales bacterium]|nr:TRAP transporter substrate-binding protein DctP [Dehalococcoidales bacterium]